MKPVLVIQHIPSDGPGSFGRWLADRQLASRRIEVFREHRIPDDLSPYGGLCVLGGPMHAHDPLPHLDQTVDLIRQAIARQIPVIGHCLGGQLLARALGEKVVRQNEPELGWQQIERIDNAESRRWLGEAPAFTVLQWHYDSFGIPDAAVQIARSAVCENQAFTFDGRHIGMQFHVEGDAQKVDDWCAECADDLVAAAHFRSVQQEPLMRAGTGRFFPAMEALAFRIYDEWRKGLAS